MSIDQDGLANVKQIDYDNKVIPKEVVSNFLLSNCSGNDKSGNICKVNDSSKPLIINANLELGNLTVDLSGKGSVRSANVI